MGLKDAPGSPGRSDMALQSHSCIYRRRDDCCQSAHAVLVNNSVDIRGVALNVGVEQDVRNKYVSVEKARVDYGVVIDPASLTVDLVETEKARAKKKTN